MQRTPRPANLGQKKSTSRIKKYANIGIITLAALSAAGLGAVAVQGQQAVAINAQAAKSYKPAITYTVPSAPMRVAFLGDSFTAGAKASDQDRRWTTLLAKEQGWVELNYGSGGTNYGTESKLNRGEPYAERLTDLVLSRPDLVIVSSAGNSLEEDQVPGMRKTFQALRKQLPNGRIIATSPYYRADEMPSRLVDFGEDVRREIEAAGGEYLDIGHPLLGHPEAMSDDGAHPNDAGYQLIADAIRDALKDVGVTDRAAGR